MRSPGLYMRIGVRRCDEYLAVIGRERLCDRCKRRTKVHSPIAWKSGLLEMHIGTHQDQALAKKPGNFTGLRFGLRKRFRVCQGHVKPVNQHQTIDFIPVLDEGTKTVNTAGKEQRYATGRSGSAG